MISLEEALKIYKSFGASDMDIIKQYFTQNDLECEAIALIGELVKTKVEKDEFQIRNMSYAVAMPTPISYLTSEYAGCEADLLNRITLSAQILGRIPAKLLKEASKIVPKLMKPDCFYQDAITMLGINGINFKNDKKKYTEKDIQNKEWYLKNKEMR